jgi:hypothetical protein
MALDDVLYLRDLEQVTGAFGGAGVAVSGLYGCGTAISTTRYISVGEVILFFV